MKKIIISSVALVIALRKAQKAMKKNPAIPILENFLLMEDREKRVLNVMASNLEFTAIAPVTFFESRAKDEPFEALLPLGALKYLEKIEEQPITIEVKEGKNKKGEKELQLVIGTDYANAKYATSNPDEFQVVPPIDGPSFEVNMEGDHLKMLSAYTGKDDLRPAFSYLFFQFADGVQKIVATDAHKMVVNTSENKAQGALNFLLPASAAKVMAFGDGVAKVTLMKQSKEAKKLIANNFYGAQGLAKIETGDMTYYVRLFDGKYVNYQQVIPSDLPVKATMERKVIIKEMDRALIFANKTTHQVRLHLNGALEVSAEDLDFANEYKSNVHADIVHHAGDTDFEIGFNGKFLGSILKDLKGDKVTLEMNTPNRAAIINEGPNMYLLMPVMLNS